MTQGISGTLLLDSAVIDDPYPFYGRLHAEAPVWEVPGTGLFTVSTFELLAEATGRVEDFSSNIQCLLYRDDEGIPCRLPFGDAGTQALATADPPVHALHRNTVFPELVAKRMEALEPDVIEGTVRILAEDQGLQEHLRQNLEQIPTFVEEVLRLASTTASGHPLPVSRRATCSPCYSSAPAASPSTPSTRRGGSIA